MPNTTINFTVDNSNIDSGSDVNVNVTAINVFGSGSISNVTMAEIGELCSYVNVSLHLLKNFTPKASIPLAAMATTQWV